MAPRRPTAQSGITFVEVIIVAALSVMVFGAIFISFQFALELVAINRAKLSAVSLANDRMEYFRSLPYDEVGTLTGLVRGPVPNSSVRQLNNIDFTERVVVQYVDGAGDGIAGADINGILTDYKQIKLEYTWTQGERTENIALVSNIMPRAIESDVGGGSIRVNVLDQDLTPLSGARVELINGSTTAPIYEDRLSNLSGQVLFSGVPADSDYELIVSGTIAGQTYSVDQTYQASSTNQNPVRVPFAVIEDGVATQTFFIDELSDLSIQTKSAVIEDSALESFTDTSGIASSTGTTTVAANRLMLGSTSGVYSSPATVYLAPIVPTTLDQWETIRTTAALPVGTAFAVQLYTGDAVGGYTLIPDADVPSNSTGFSDTIIDISILDASSYPTITIGINLSTIDVTVTPEVLEIQTFWRESGSNLGNQSFSIRGDKTIGNQDDLSPVYKFQDTVATDGTGELSLADLEFDTYTFDIVGSLDIASACPAHPLSLRGGEDTDLEIVYVSNQINTMRVVVQDALGRPLPGATVTLSRSGYSATQSTNTCGQTFFTGGLADETDYTLETTVAGFAPDTITGMSVSGDGVITITLTP